MVQGGGEEKRIENFTGGQGPTGRIFSISGGFRSGIEKVKLAGGFRSGIEKKLGQRHGSSRVEVMKSSIRFFQVLNLFSVISGYVGF